MTGESPVVFDCHGEQLVGILHRPAAPSGFGVIVIVGGPQYRVGSHRQFVLLARTLARRGHTVLRFDCRGMGDSGGEFPGFERISDDITAAVGSLWQHAPGLRGVVLWGLCDAASAALMFAPHDPRVAGLVLLNPWVRSEATLARTYLRHYYLARLMSRDFWRKIFSGRLRPARVIGDMADNVRKGSGQGPTGAPADFVSRMHQGLREFEGPVSIVLSGNDITATEFCGVAEGPDWQAVLNRPSVTIHRMVAANHTFSTAAWRGEVENCSADLLDRLQAAAGVTPR